MLTQSNLAQVPPPVTVPREPRLYVDLDGSLIKTDVLWESVLLFLRWSPMRLPHIVRWACRGKANLKSRLAAEVSPDILRLPYRKDVLAYLLEQHDRGREVVLATGTNERVAEQIARHIGLFSAVLASSETVNLVGDRKLAAIREHSGGGVFDYVGNAPTDLRIWKEAREAIVVQPPAGLLKRVNAVTQVGAVFERRQNRMRIIRKALRAEQWVKNLLLFVPLILAHQLGNLTALSDVLWAFIAFSLCASSVYVVNDLLDIENDRQHPRKQHRPFASGALQVRDGLILAPVLLVSSLAIAAVTLPVSFLVLLVGYFTLTTAYSFSLKRVAIVDVIVLATLYTFRLIGGGIAADVRLSPWLLAFSIFVFLSLALAKRYAELRMAGEEGLTTSAGRGYQVTDLSFIGSVGPTSGYIAVLVLVLYANSSTVVELYQRPEVLWLLSPLLLYWITRIWLLAHRGELSDDPIVFTLRDAPSYAVFLGVAAVLVFATL